MPSAKRRHKQGVTLQSDQNELLVKMSSAGTRGLSILGMPLGSGESLQSARGNVQRVGRTATGMNMFVLRGRGPAGF